MKHIENKGKISSKKVLDVALRVASNKGENTIVFDIREKSPIFNYAIVTSALSTQRLKSIAEEASEALKDNKFSIHHTEGRNGSKWVLVDASEVVVHVFLEDERERINLEALYKDCPTKVISDEEVDEYLTKAREKLNESK